jgi:cytochrome c551/c552
MAQDKVFKRVFHTVLLTGAMLAASAMAQVPATIAEYQALLQKLDDIKTGAPAPKLTAREAALAKNLGAVVNDKGLVDLTAPTDTRKPVEYFMILLQDLALSQRKHSRDVRELDRGQQVAQMQAAAADQIRTAANARLAVAAASGVTQGAAGGVTMSGAARALAEPTFQFFADKGCRKCHTVQRMPEMPHLSGTKFVGPSLMDIAARYADKADAKYYLADRIVGGGSGTWGSKAMPPGGGSPTLSYEEATILAKFIMNFR